MTEANANKKVKLKVTNQTFFSQLNNNNGTIERVDLICNLHIK